MFNFQNTQQYSFKEFGYSFQIIQEKKQSPQELFKKCQMLNAQNQMLKRTITQLTAEKELKQLKKHKKKVNRRKENQLEKIYCCPYQNCIKQYASKLALNLHIKIKHNGGSKRQRDSIIKKILIAQEKGLKKPQININLPKSQIQMFKIIHAECKQLSSDSDSQYQC